MSHKKIIKEKLEKKSTTSYFDFKMAKARSLADNIFRELENEKFSPNENITMTLKTIHEKNSPNSVVIDLKYEFLDTNKIELI